MERDLRQAFRWVCRGKALIYDSGRVPARKAPGKAPWGRCLPVERAALPLHRENGRGEVGRSNRERMFFPSGREGRVMKMLLPGFCRTGGKGEEGIPTRMNKREEAEQRGSFPNPDGKRMC